MRQLICTLVLLFAGGGVLTACSDGLSSATEHADLLAQVETLTSQFNEVVATDTGVAELHTQVNKLTSQLAEAAVTDTEMSELRAEVKSLTSQLADSEAEVSKVNSYNSELRSTLEDLKESPTSTLPAVPTTTLVEQPIVDVPESEVELILTAVYGWGPSSAAEALQTVLNVTADGWYGNQTRSAHLAELETRGLPTDGVPIPPTTTTEAPAETPPTTTTG